MNTRLQKINEAIFSNPNLIPILLKDCSIEKGLIYSRLRRAVPRKVGIEFECIGNPADYYKYQLNNKITFPSDLGNCFNLFDYDQDLRITSPRSHGTSVRMTLNTDLTEGNNPRFRAYSDNLNSTFNELRVCIKDYSQLRGLYNILKLFKRSCIIPTGGGIHIHIDFRDYQTYETRVIASRYIYNHLKEVEAIFPKYTGTYNKRKVGISEKGTYVNLSCHGSVEFRIAPLTFEYEDLIKWVINCNKFVTKVIHECHLISDKDIKVYNLKKYPNIDLGDRSGDQTQVILDHLIHTIHDYESMYSNVNRFEWNHIENYIS